MIAVSLNVGGGVRFIKSVKLYRCTQNTGQTHGAWCARPWFRTAEPLGDSGNVVTRIGIYVAKKSIKPIFEVCKPKASKKGNTEISFLESKFVLMLIKIKLV